MRTLEPLVAIPSADPQKIEVVKKMEIPQDVEMMRSFLGLINYLNQFSP